MRQRHERPPQGAEYQSTATRSLCVHTDTDTHTRLTLVRAALQTQQFHSLLCTLHRGSHVCALCQLSGNGRGQAAPCAVRVAGAADREREAAVGRGQNQTLQSASSHHFNPSWQNQVPELAQAHTCKHGRIDSST